MASFVHAAPPSRLSAANLRSSHQMLAAQSSAHHFISLLPAGAGAGAGAGRNSCLAADGLTCESRLWHLKRAPYFVRPMRASLSGNRLAKRRPHASGDSASASLSADASAVERNDPVLSSDLSEQEFAQQWARKPRRIALFVEPSPFAYICGYKNRFQNFIRNLREMGDEVIVVTTHKGVPEEFHGAKVVGSWSFPCPLYTILPLSLALSPRIIKAVSDFKPDIIHASSPGIMCIGALIISKLLSIPLVLSYHTHVPVYIPKYTFSWLVEPMWAVIRFLHRAADLTLVVSRALGKELLEHACSAGDQLKVWRKGIDSDTFHPRFRSAEFRAKMSDGEPDRPLIVHVGRLGAEKNLDFLKKVQERLPDARFCFVGDGPYRLELEKMFAGTPTTFTGMLSGDDLSMAYASADVFITPSESETLGFVVLEAMAAGTPVVAARAGGIPDIISHDGETGFLYTPGDLEECLGKIRALLDSKPLREKVAVAARKDIENFDWRASTKQVRNEAYSAAIRFWMLQRERKRSWFPWSTQQRELKPSV